MVITVRYFASIREAVGCGTQRVETRASTLRELLDELIAKGGPLAQCLTPGRAMRMAVDHQLSDESAVLLPGCEVAFFPPVTGG